MNRRIMALVVFVGLMLHASALQAADGDLVVQGDLIVSGGSNLLPAGTLVMYGGSSVPSGWLRCDGTEVSRTEYASLFAAIGTTFGAGNNSTTFNLPNFKGRSPVGVGQGNTAEGGGFGANRLNGEVGGAETHTLILPEMPAHSHLQHASTVNGSYAAGGGAARGPFTSQTGMAGGGTSHNNMHPFLGINFIIKH